MSEEAGLMAAIEVVSDPNKNSYGHGYNEKTASENLRSWSYGSTRAEQYLNVSASRNI